jgi:hypothetical protein
MAVPRRFALSTLLIAMLAVALVLGFLTWRKNTLKAEVATINRERIAHLTLTDNFIWPRIKSEASLFLKKDNKGVLYLSEKPASLDTVIAKFQETEKRIRELGVKQVTILFAEEELHKGDVVEVLRVVNSDDISRAVKIISK